MLNKTCKNTRSGSKVNRLRSKLQKAKEEADHWKACYEIAKRGENRLHEYRKTIEARNRELSDLIADYQGKYEQAKIDYERFCELEAYISFLERFLRYTQDKKVLKRIEALKEEEVSTGAYLAL